MYVSSGLTPSRGEGKPLTTHLLLCKTSGFTLSAGSRAPRSLGHHQHRPRGLPRTWLDHHPQLVERMVLPGVVHVLAQQGPARGGLQAGVR